MRLINADDKLLRAELFTYINTGMETAINAIDKAPTIDAVEVVRCKNCKYWHSNTEFCDVWSHMNIAQRTLADDYCSLAERREESEVEE